MDGERIQAAIAALLDACYASDDPVATLHAELTRLSAEGEWSQLQLTQLQLMTLEKVKAIADQASSNGRLQCDSLMPETE